MLYQMQTLFTVELYKRIFAFDETEKAGKEVVVAYFKAVYQHFPRRVLVGRVAAPVKTRTVHLPNASQSQIPGFHRINVVYLMGE
jgi:hypothetical protein